MEGFPHENSRPVVGGEPQFVTVDNVQVTAAGVGNEVTRVNPEINPNSPAGIQPLEEGDK